MRRVCILAPAWAVAGCSVIRQSATTQQSTSTVVHNRVQLSVMAARASSGLPPVPPAMVPQAPVAVPVLPAPRPLVGCRPTATTNSPTK